MTARDGDGWVDCACGNKHWGLNGAAGILIVRGTQILLQHRAPWVHNGDTWGIPGGARDSHESTIEGAFREAVEETGIDTSLLTVLHTYTDDHGDWKYLLEQNISFTYKYLFLDFFTCQKNTKNNISHSILRVFL